MPEQGAPSLFPEPAEVAPPPGRGLHGYYRRGDNGWIVVASTTPSNRSDYEYKGFRFLPQYGEFKNGTNELRARQLAADDRGVAWNPAIEPWRLIFQRRGAGEFPVEQIIAYRWHLRPPYKEVTFPQIDGVDITTYPCPECEKGIFSSTNDKEAAQQLRTHLTSGVNQRHNYTATDLRELGKELAIDFDSARVGRVQAVKEQMGVPASMEPDEVPELTPAPVPEEPCECGWESTAKEPHRRKSIAMHENLHCPLRKKEAVPA